MTVTAANARVYAWQADNHLWYVSALNGDGARSQETNLLLWRAGLDRSFDSRTDVSAALRAWRGYGL